MVKNSSRLLYLPLILLFACIANSQIKSGPSAGKTAPTAVDSAAAIELARAALNGHGGEKLKGVKTLVFRGSVDVTVSAFNQAFVGAFVMVIAGEKYRVEITNPFQPIKQVFDGTTTSSNIQNGFNLPPVNRLGLPLLARLGDPGFVVTPLAESRKSSGFRVTAPDGWYTDFYIDEKTKQVKKYEAAYELNGRVINTIVEIDKMRIVDGIVLPEKFAQRFDLGQVTAYADFKAKEILVNSPVDDEVFTLTK